MQGPPLFKFFLDGSRKVYKVDDIQYDKTIYPVIGGQISVACCRREMTDDNRFHSFRCQQAEAYSVICLPNTANGDGVEEKIFFNNLRDKINSRTHLEQRGIEIKEVLSYSTKLDKNQTYENLGIAKIQDEMISCEKSIVASLVRKRLLNEDNYLIKDGSIQYKVMKHESKNERTIVRNNYRYVIGVSKRFNPNLMKDNKNQSLAGQIAQLPLFHRTPAFLCELGEEWNFMKLAIWYVRIRDISKSDTPYAGILKVEKMLMIDHEKEEGLSSDLIDTISANLINERNPVCYGNDTRWANHLYPIYMTECFCKNRFKSDNYFLNLF